MPVISTNSATELLNAYYPVMMQKIWDQLDPREIMSYRKDAEKLKGATQYRGGQ